MTRYMLKHRHESAECRIAYAAWQGFDSPLRHSDAEATCASAEGERAHEMWWRVEAPGEAEALAQLPDFVAERTEASQVEEVPIP